MKRKITFLLSALFALTLLAQPIIAVGQSVGTTLWAETWTGSTTATSGSNSATPSSNYGNGTTVYNSGTVTYTQSKNTVYVRNDNYAGGSKPELMITSGETWTISNIPTAGASKLTLTYKSNNTNSSVTCSTDGTSISGSSKSYEITTGGASKITLVFSSSGNSRIDDVSLVIKTLSGGPSITVSNVNLLWNATSGSFDPAPSVSNPVAGGTLTAATDSDWLSVASTSPYGLTCSANPLNYARKATVTFTYTYNTNQTVTQSVTVTQAANPNGIGSLAAPFTITEAQTFIETLNGATATDDHYVKGIISQIDSYSSNKITYWISADGTTTGQFEVYNGKGIGDANFSAVGDLQLGNQVTIKGKLKKFSSTYEFADGSIITSYISKSSLTALNYTYGSGPSAAQTINVGGADLSANLALSLDENSDFEISTSANSGYGSSISLTPTSNVVASTTVYVRLKNNLSKENYAGTITVSTTGTINKTVSLSGSVTAATHAITQYSDPATVHGTITFAPTSPVAEGTEVTLSAEAATGYDFTANSWVVYKEVNSEWVTDNSVTVTNNKLTMPEYDIKVGGTFTAKPTYDISSSVTPANSGTIATDSEAWEGKEVTVLVEAEDGYAFSSLSVTKTSDAGTTVEYSGNAADGFTFTMPAYDVTVTATFVHVYHISYEANIAGATGSTTDSNDYEEDDEATVLVCGFSKTGYAFSHWNTTTYDTGDSYDAGDKITIGTSDVTLYAQWVEVSSVTYTIGSTTSVSISSGTAPLGSIASFSQTYSTACQMTKDNSMTLTVKGCQGRTVKSIVLSMKSNGSSGSGNMTAKAGNTTISSIATGTFASEQWNGSYSSSYVNITPDMSNANYELKSNEDIVITIAATANSLFCQSFTINYATTTKDPMVFAVPSAQVVTNEEQDITTSDDEAFSIASLNIATPSYSIAYCDEDGNVLGSNPYSWFDPSISSNKVVYSVEENTEDTDRIAYFKVYATVSATNYYSALCSVTQKHQPFTYTLVDGTDVKLEAGKHYIIANSKTNGDAYAMGAQESNNRTAVPVEVSSSSIEELDGVYEFVISGDNTNNWTIYDIQNSGYLYAAGSGSGKNYLRTQSTNDNNGIWTISISSGVATITAQGTNTNNLLQKNTSGTFFSCYSSSQSAVYLYKRDNDKDLEFYSPTTIASATIASDETYTVESGQVLEVTGTLTNNGTAANLIIEDGGQLITTTGASVKATVKKNITTWSDGTKTVAGWHAISSPVDGFNFTSGGNFVATGGEEHYTMYAYDEKNCMWINSQDENDHFNTLAKGQGYLYRKTNNTTVEIAGDLVTSDFNYLLSFAGEGSTKGFNLIGNPYTHNIYKGEGTAIPNNYLKNGFYYLTSAGGFTLRTDNDDPIAPGQAVLVQATEANNLVFTNTPSDGSAKANHDKITFKVANSQYEDVACAMFDKGEGINKISHRNEDIPMIYIPQNGKNYALAMFEDNTEVFGLNFKAATMGKYTLSYKAKGEFNYLHIIDRLTGEDVDMLLESEYSFIASPTDSDNRFIVRLAYLPNYGEENDIFAYQSGNEIFVSGTGELQIFDVTGRFVMSERINGATSISADALSKGVYVLRIVGSEIKTQKIVVR